MAPNRYSRQWNDAIETIHAAIGETRASGAPRLPSVKALAARAGVSSLTMWRAARSVCDQGALVSIPRGGFLLTGTEPPRQLPRSVPMAQVRVDAAPRWRSVMDCLLGEIESLRLAGHTQLPTQKQLAARHRTSAGSMRVALTQLERSGLIQRAARGHVVRLDAPLGATAEIAVIARVGIREECHHMSPRSTEFWRNLDLQCQRRNVRLRLFGVSPALRALERNHGPAYECIARNPSTIGFVVLTLGLSELEAKKLCGHLSATSRRAAVIDELGQPWMTDAARQNQARLYHLGGGELPGRMIGEHLARMGHREVCWFAPAQGDDDYWVTQRLKGLREGLAAGGRACSVTSYVPDNFTRMADIGAAIETDPLYGRLLDQIRQMPALIPPECPAPDSLFVNRSAHNYLLFRFIRRGMEPLFAHVLGSSRATAWVACNDDIAVMAMDFLQRCEVSVPGKVALVGFDDSELAQTRDITSYNFSVASTVQSVFDYIIDSTMPLRSREQVVEGPGFVAIRASTARRHVR